MKLKISQPKDKVKTIKKRDPDFSFNVGISIYPRAGIEISQRCPDNYKDVIIECIRNEWLKPVAYMKESEYIWERLK